MNRSVINRPILFIGLASFFTDIASESIYPLLPLFLTTVLGASPAFIGLVEGIAESTASLTKYFFGWWSDKTNKRTPFVVGGYSIANMVRPLIGIATVPWHALVIRFMDRVGKGMRTAARDAWLATLTPPEKRATVYGFHRSMDHAGAVLGPLLATTFLWFSPGEYRSLFLWAFVPGFLGVVCVLLAKRSQATYVVDTSFSGQTDVFVTPPLFKKYLAVIFLFTLGCSSDAFLLLKLKMSGVDEKFILLLWSALHVVKSASSYYGGRFADRSGKKKSILLGWAVYGIIYFLFGIIAHPIAISIVFISYGLFFGLTEGVEKALVANLVPEKNRGRAFGLFHLMEGLAVLPASLLFGFLWNQFGITAAFFVGAGFAGLASCFLLMLPIEENQKL